MEGTVTSFDDHRGYGTIRSADRDFFFHCTRLVDGSRIVAEGTPVTFSVVPGHGGRWEAAAIAKG